VITKNDIENANMMDIASYLKTQGISIKRVGSAYEWESPTGKVSIKGNRWYSQYEMVGGYPINFVMKYFNLEFKDAVSSLLGNSYTLKLDTYEVEEKKTKKFVVPKKNDSMSRVFFYLRDVRCIDERIINVFAKAGLLFEDTEFHNAVFVGKDVDGHIKHIHKRSTIKDSVFKGNVEASDPECSFNWRGKSNRLFVFEAPIDMLSYISMHKEGWRDHSYVALCSTAGIAAIKQLQDNSNIDKVYLCLDNDNAGTVGSERIAEQIHTLGDYEIWRLFPQNKDWNEDIQLKNKNDYAEDDTDVVENEEQNKLMIGEI
jgi:hypothetical protein